MVPFKILWFEDNSNDFTDIINEIKIHVQKIGRNLEYDLHDHYPEDFDVKMFEGDYCVAFIDLNLNNGQKGIEIINILRDKGTFMDILLYSNNPLELEKLTEGENYVEGVFRHATMNGITDKMKEVIDQVNYKEIMVLKRNGY